MDATEEMREPPQRTETPPPAGNPCGGVDQPAMQHADPPGMAANGSGEASIAGQPGTDPEEPMPDAGHEARLHPPSAHGAQPAGRADDSPLANPAHHADASAQGGAPPRGPSETRAKSEARQATSDTPQRAAGRETSPSGHNRDEDFFEAFMESCTSDAHVAPRVRPEPRRDYAEGKPLTMSRQAHLQRNYTAQGHSEHATAPVTGPRLRAEQPTRLRRARRPRKRGACGGGHQHR